MTIASGQTLTFGSGSTVEGGTLAGPGLDILTNGSTLNGTRVGSGVTLSQSGGLVAFNNVFLTGNATFTQAAGATLNTTGDLNANPQTALTINGTVNAAGGSVSGALTINSGGGVNTGGGAAAPLYLDGSRGATVNVGGQLNAATGSSVELGGLLVNNGTQTGVLDVNLGGVARGTGTFGTVNVADGGRFSPGNGTGMATVNSLNLEAGGTYQFELASAAAADDSPGNHADLIDASQLLTISAGTTSNSRFTVAVVSLDGNNNPAALGDFDPGKSYRFVLATAAGGIAGFNSADFTVDTTGFANGLAGGSFSVIQDGNNLDLVFTPVPEPSTWTLLGVGTLGLFAVALRRRVRAA